MKRMQWAPIALLIPIFVAACNRSPSDPEPTPETESVDCTAANRSCPELMVAGDQPYQPPGDGTSPARGYADPSMRKSPTSSRLWMAYSWIYPEGASVRVESHLARSDDSGASWTLHGELWPSVSVTDENGEEGHINSEVVTLAPRAVGGGEMWYSARLAYFTRAGRPSVRSFTIRVAAAPSPTQLATAEEAILGGAFTEAQWGVDTDLSALHSDLDGCTWNDPGLLYHQGSLYLAMQCSVFVGGAERPEEQFVAVFETDPAGSPRDWQWRYNGKLAGHAEAVELGSEVLMQTDLAVGTDGQLLALLSPSRPNNPLADHFGCRVLEVASLESPGLVRNDDGTLRVRASVTATDPLPSGPGACGYDPASSTGVVLTRRDLGQGQLVVSLNASGLKP